VARVRRAAGPPKPARWSAIRRRAWWGFSAPNNLLNGRQKNWVGDDLRAVFNYGEFLRSEERPRLVIFLLSKTTRRQTQGRRLRRFAQRHGETCRRLNGFFGRGGRSIVFLRPSRRLSWASLPRKVGPALVFSMVVGPPRVAGCRECTIGPVNTPTSRPALLADLSPPAPLMAIDEVADCALHLFWGRPDRRIHANQNRCRCVRCIRYEQ